MFLRLADTGVGQNLVNCSNCSDCSGLKDASNLHGVHQNEAEL